MGGYTKIGLALFDDPLFSVPAFYVAASLAVLLLGLSKGGFAGLGMLAVPVLSMVMSPVQAAAITLPILIAQDMVSLWLFRGQWDKRLVAILLAGAVVGVLAGFSFAAALSVAAVKLALGLISAVFGLQRLWLERPGGVAPTRLAPPWLGVTLGAISGLTSQIAHAGAPPVQMYLMSRGLERDVFIGTSTLFFALLNWIKVPAYSGLGQFTPANLAMAAVLLPFAILATLLGARVARRVDGPLFFRIANVLMVGLGAKLIWDGAAGLLSA